MNLLAFWMPRMLRMSFCTRVVAVAVTAVMGTPYSSCSTNKPAVSAMGRGEVAGHSQHLLVPAVSTQLPTSNC